MYLKKGTLINEIEADLKQTFHHDFTMNISRDVILKMKHEDKLSDRDLKIAELIYRFHFATAEQVTDYLNDPEYTVGAIQARLDKLVHHRVLNKFLLSKTKEDRVYQDAMIIYCLDLGGKYLLSSFSSHDTSDWFTSNNFRISELIAKDLMTLDFYLKLYRQTEGKIEYFESSSLFQAGGSNIYPSFHFAIKVDGMRRYYIGEVVQEDDLPLLFRKKAEKLSYLLGTNAWKKYFFDIDEYPTLLIVAPNDLCAVEVAKGMKEVAGLDRYRITTPERSSQPLHEAGAFLRYLPDHGMLQPVRFTAFDPTKLG